MEGEYPALSLPRFDAIREFEACTGWHKINRTIQTVK